MSIFRRKVDSATEMLISNLKLVRMRVVRGMKEDSWFLR